MHALHGNTTAARQERVTRHRAAMSTIEEHDPDFDTSRRTLGEDTDAGAFESVETFGRYMHPALFGEVDDKADLGRQRCVRTRELPFLEGRVLGIVDGEPVPREIPSRSSSSTTLKTGATEQGNTEYIFRTGVSHDLVAGTRASACTWINEPGEGSQANCAFRAVWTSMSAVDQETHSTPNNIDHVPFLVIVVEQLRALAEGEELTALYCDHNASLSARASSGFPYKAGEKGPRQPCAEMEDVSLFIRSLGLTPSSVVSSFGIPLDDDAFERWTPRRSTPITSMSIGTNGIVLFGGYTPDVPLDDEGWPPRRPMSSSPSEMDHATMWTGSGIRAGDTLRGPRLDATLRVHYTARAIGQAFKIAWLWRCFVSGRVPVRLRGALRLGPYPTAAKIAQYRTVLRKYVNTGEKGPGVPRIFFRPVSKSRCGYGAYGLFPGLMATQADFDALATRATEYCAVYRKYGADLLRLFLAHDLAAVVGNCGSGGTAAGLAQGGLRVYLHDITEQSDAIRYFGKETFKVGDSLDAVFLTSECSRPGVVEQHLSPMCDWLSNLRSVGRARLISPPPHFTPALCRLRTDRWPPPRHSCSRKLRRLTKPIRPLESRM